jgi:outer membrane lipoprotein
MRHIFIAVGFILTLAACSSNVPYPIREPLANNPVLSEVQNRPAAHSERAVRWGGTIVAIRNDVNQVELEILSKPLDDEGRPEHTDAALGRFLVRFAGFLDPEIYRPQREITVYGTLKGSREGSIGERRYTYPIVQAIQFHVWPGRTHPETPNVHFGIGVGFGF